MSLATSLVPDVFTVVDSSDKRSSNGPLHEPDDKLQGIIPCLNAERNTAHEKRLRKENER